VKQKRNRFHWAGERFDKPFNPTDVHHALYFVFHQADLPVQQKTKMNLNVELEDMLDAADLPSS